MSTLTPSLFLENLFKLKSGSVRSIEVNVEQEFSRDASGMRYPGIRIYILSFETFDVNTMKATLLHSDANFGGILLDQYAINSGDLERLMTMTVQAHLLHGKETRRLLSLLDISYPFEHTT